MLLPSKQKTWIQHRHRRCSRWSRQRWNWKTFRKEEPTAPPAFSTGSLAFESFLKLDRRDRGDRIR